MLIDSGSSLTVLLFSHAESVRGKEVSCRDIKMMLVGEPEVAKTTLLRQLSGSSASDEMSHISQATDRIDLESVMFDGYTFGVL
jgi:stage III sporulation protein SpoIIIAA